MNHLLEIVREHWSWAVSDPQEILMTNEFGNVIFRDGDDRIWRICPEKFECSQIADTHEGLTALLEDSKFLADWNMDAVATEARVQFGQLTEGRCFFLKLSKASKASGDKYVTAVVRTIPLIELIRLAGNCSRSLGGTVDGGRTEWREASDACEAHTFWMEKMDGRRITCEVTLRSCFRTIVGEFWYILLVLPVIVYLKHDDSDGALFDLREGAIIVGFGFGFFGLMFLVGFVIAYFFQHKRVVTVDTSRRVVVFKGFPVPKSVFRNRVHRELVVPFHDIARTQSRGIGVEMVEVFCPAGRLRVYSYMTNFKELQELLCGIPGAMRLTTTCS